MSMPKKLLKYAVLGTAGVGTLFSLKNNDFDPGSIGIVRLGRAAVTVFIIGQHYQRKLYGSGFNRDSPEYKQLKSEVHLFGAHKLLELCCANKGVFIKVGQHIGALDYLLPAEYVKTLRVLHSSAPQSPFKDILTVLKEDLKCDPYELFSSIETEPVGAASLAQVHRAVLKDGTPVALKVQHKSVMKNSYVDIKTMAALVKLTSWVFPDFEFDWLVRETKKNIPNELNFAVEGRNAETVQEMFKEYSWLKVPKIFWNLSSSRILTMEFIDGGQVNDLEYIKKNQINPFEVTSKLGKLYSRMIFITGFVHSDPHPGNILVKNVNGEAEVVLLDHGLYANLTDQFRWDYSKLWISILNGDKDGMKEHCTNLGVGELYPLLACMVSGRTWDTIISGMRKKSYDKREKDMFQAEIPNLLPQITNVLQRVDPQMLLILKTNDLVRCIEHNLGTQARMSASMEMSKCCVESVFGEKLKSCSSATERWKITFGKQWAYFKLSMYYIYLGISNFDLMKSVQSLWYKDFYPI